MKIKLIIFQGCALGLILKVRFFGTRKWPISSECRSCAICVYFFVTFLVFRTAAITKRRNGKDWKDPKQNSHHDTKANQQWFSEHQKTPFFSRLSYRFLKQSEIKLQILVTRLLVNAYLLTNYWGTSLETIDSYPALFVMFTFLLSRIPVNKGTNSRLGLTE